MIEATTVEQLIAIESSERDRTERESLCQLEKEKEWFPENCLKKLQMELIALAKSRELERIFKTVNRLCLLRYQKIQNVGKLDEILKGRALPEPCRQKLLSHRLDLEYAESSESGPNFVKTSADEDY